MVYCSSGWFWFKGRMQSWERLGITYKIDRLLYFRKTNWWRETKSRQVLFQTIWRNVLFLYEEMYYFSMKKTLQRVAERTLWIALIIDVMLLVKRNYELIYSLKSKYNWTYFFHKIKTYHLYSMICYFLSC